MAFYEQDELQPLYDEAKKESYEWRKNYNEYERLADNGLIEDLDENLPEVNDGSLSAALFKLPKRIVDDNLSGRAKALDADDAWITELANIYWTNKIIPNANSQATFHRKLKAVVRKAAIYGSQPVISLLMDKDDETTADFIVPYVSDVRLEPGKVSDQDSDIIFWDIYYTKKQVRDLIEQAEAETKDAKEDKAEKTEQLGEQEVEAPEGVNKWDILALKAILEGKHTEDRDQKEDHEGNQDKSVTKGGIKFCIAFQRGIKAPFYMYHWGTNKVVREWENPDPTGDLPVKYLYCYQDFNNPYGIGIVKLAGGTQNVLDIMRQYDVLATQLGIRPPRIIKGNEDEVDEDSMVNAQDANWFVGGADVSFAEMANGVYNQLPTRIGMYQSSLNKLLPMGDTSVSAEAGDPLQSKTPAGVKFQQAQLSIDDEDFKDNLHAFYEQVAKNLINLTFANMEGTDLLKLSDDERELLQSSGLEFPVDEMGEPTNELEIIWDEARATFDFEVDAEDSKTKDEEKRLEGLLRIVELRATDPSIEQSLMMSGYQLNLGELFSSIINLTTDNDKILKQLDPEEMAGMQQQQAQDQMMQEQAMTQKDQEQPQESSEPSPEQVQANMEAVMAEHGVDEQTAAELLDAEYRGIPPEEILASLEQAKAEQGAIA
jgi:hypothetical protein